MRAETSAGFGGDSFVLSYNLPSVITGKNVNKQIIPVHSSISCYLVNTGAAISGSPSSISVVVMAVAGWLLILLMAFFVGLYLCRRKGKTGPSLTFRESQGTTFGNNFQIFTNPVATDQEDLVS